MPERRKFRVYLAGPISHCNESQKRRWRETVKHEYKAKMTFLDPVENLLGPEASAYEVVAADIRLIEQARAAHAGMSMSDYVLREIRQSLDRPTRQEVFARLAELPPIQLAPPPADGLRNDRNER